MLQTEEQNQPIPPAPEIAPQTESKESSESKPVKRGGKRKGAGRPPNVAKRILKGYSRDAMIEAVTNLDLKAKLNWLLSSKSAATVLQTLAFIRDTIDGRPAQNVQFSGAVLHAHWTHDKYAHLTDEQFAELVVKTIRNPLRNNQNAHQNQIESKPALEAEVVASEGNRGALGPSCGTVAHLDT